MAEFKITVNDQEYEVEVGKVTTSPITVRVDGKSYRVQWERVQEEIEVQHVKAVEEEQVEESPVALEEAPSAAIEPTGEGELVEIAAPMPGKILQVDVTSGDKVEEGQQVCSLEAMKMESAIQTTAAGRVISVNVGPGDNVQYGDVLVVVEK